jgi:hypothetical protein
MEEYGDLIKRCESLRRFWSGPEVLTAAVVMELGDRLVGSLDGILSALRAIEEHLGSLHDERIP